MIMRCYGELPLVLRSAVHNLWSVDIQVLGSDVIIWWSVLWDTVFGSSWSVLQIVRPTLLIKCSGLHVVCGAWLCGGLHVSGGLCGTCKYYSVVDVTDYVMNITVW